MWTVAELDTTLPRLLPADPTWKATASHNAERAGNGLTLAAWTSGVPQEPGMWFQVELPQPALITEVQFDAGAPGGRGGGRGGAGRGGAGRGAANPPAAAQPPAGAAQPRATSPAPAPPAATPPPQAARGNAPPVFGSYPLAYRVEVSLDGKSWSTPVGEGKGSPSTAIVTFRPVRAKFVRITQTEKAEQALPWSVLNFRVFVAGT
jgi:hypothetical protein